MTVDESRVFQARSFISEIASQLDTSPSARLDARILLGIALGRGHPVLSHEDICISHAQRAHLERLITQRHNGVPVSRLRGFREFFGLTFWLNDACLDPRPDSEILVQTALRLLAEKRGAGWPRIVDLGTGTGCLLLSVLKSHHQARGIGIDCQPRAIAQARANAAALGLADRAAFQLSNWTENLKGRYDLCLCNPPYIANDDPECGMEVRAHDPHQALFAGDDGLDDYRRIFSQMPEFLSDEGYMVVEIGYRQAGQVEQIAKLSGFSMKEMASDLAGRPRCLVFKKTG